VSFDDNSRYKKAALRQAPGPNGRLTTLVDPPPQGVEPIYGWHLYVQGQRLDQLAHKYLRAPTQWWRLADLNDAMWPDAVVDSPELAVPPRKRSD
jgi:hypothetical protein